MKKLIAHMSLRRFFCMHEYIVTSDFSDYWHELTGHPYPRQCIKCGHKTYNGPEIEITPEVDNG